MDKLPQAVSVATLRSVASKIGVGDLLDLLEYLLRLTSGRAARAFARYSAPPPTLGSGGMTVTR